MSVNVVREHRAGGEVGDFLLEIGGDLSINRKGVRSNFVAGGLAEMPVLFTRNFLIIGARHLISEEVLGVELFGWIALSHTNEVKVGVFNSEIFGVEMDFWSETGEGGLESNWKSDGSFAVALTTPVESTILLWSTDVIGQITPDAEQAIAVVGTDINGSIVDEIGNDSDAIIGDVERFG